MGILDVIGPVMVGPSSSHTAGAVRIGLFARAVLGNEPRRVALELHGSFAATGEGHGTPDALVAGLLGFAPDDERIPRGRELAAARGIAVEFARVDLGDVHPNSVRVRLAGSDPAPDGWGLELCASSVGGGRILVWRLDGFHVELDGEYPTLVAVYPDHPGVVAEVSGALAAAQLNIAAMKVHRESRGGRALIAADLDQAPGEVTLSFLRSLHGMEMVRLIPALEFGG